MKNISKILFPTDFSDTAINAFRYALWFADHCDATVDVWHFVSPEMEPVDFPIVSGELTHKKAEAAKDVIDSFVKMGIRHVQEKHSLNQLPRVNTHVEVDATAKNIDERVADSNFDLVIMGTQGEHSTMEKLFGSVSTATMRKAPCPVLVIPPGHSEDKIINIAYAAELNEADIFKIWKVNRFLDDFNPEIKVVNVLENTIKQDELNMDEMQEFYNETSMSTSVSFYSLLGENTAELLERFCENNEIDLLVMHKQERSFLNRLFHKSLTKKIAMNLRIPLLVIK